MEVSSTSMNVASMTATAISHGLVSGRDMVSVPSVSELAANVYAFAQRDGVAKKRRLEAELSPTASQLSALKFSLDDVWLPMESDYPASTLGQQWRLRRGTQPSRRVNALYSVTGRRSLVRPGFASLNFPLVRHRVPIDYIHGMRLFINGDGKEFPEPLSLAALIEHLGMKDDRVAVELNREIVSRAHWSKTVLKDNDKLEIVHFVGGGGS